MEVVNANRALLSNYEVLDLLRSLKHAHTASKNFSQNYSERPEHLPDEKGVQNLNTVVYETMEYLEQSPSATQTDESVKNFLTAINPFSLTKAEKLQLLNLRPTTLVELELIIEEAAERLSEEKMQEILNIVSETLPPSPVLEEPELIEPVAEVEDNT